MEVYDPVERSDPPPVLLTTKEREAVNFSHERRIASLEETVALPSRLGRAVLNVAWSALSAKKGCRLLI